MKTDLERLISEVNVGIESLTADVDAADLRVKELHQAKAPMSETVTLSNQKKRMENVLSRLCGLATDLQRCKVQLAREDNPPRSGRGHSGTE